MNKLYPLILHSYLQNPIKINILYNNRRLITDTTFITYHHNNLD